MTACSFLFPFELRRRYFYCTAFGLARALQHLQQQQAAEGAVASPLDSHARELRVGRLQRQKACPSPPHAPARATSDAGCKRVPRGPYKRQVPA